jgi:hypothetical protein
MYTAAYRRNLWLDTAGPFGLRIANAFCNSMGVKRRIGFIFSIPSCNLSVLVQVLIWILVPIIGPCIRSFAPKAS